MSFSESISARRSLFSPAGRAIHRTRSESGSPLAPRSRPSSGVAPARTYSQRGVMLEIPKDTSLGLTRCTRILFVHGCSVRLGASLLEPFSLYGLAGDRTAPSRTKGRAMAFSPMGDRNWNRDDYLIPNGYASCCCVLSRAPDCLGGETSFWLTRRLHPKHRTV